MVSNINLRPYNTGIGKPWRYVLDVAAAAAADDDTARGGGGDLSGDLAHLRAETAKRTVVRRCRLNTSA